MTNRKETLISASWFHGVLFTGAYAMVGSGAHLRQLTFHFSVLSLDFDGFALASASAMTLFFFLFLFFPFASECLLLARLVRVLHI